MSAMRGTDPLIRRLLDVLGAPKRVRSFELKMRYDSVVEAHVTYLPAPVRIEAGKVVEEFAVYELVKRGERPPAIKVACDLGIVPEQLHAIEGLLAAKDAVSRRIEASALRALNEIHELANKARAELGLDVPTSLGELTFTAQ